MIALLRRFLARRPADLLAALRTVTSLERRLSTLERRRATARRLLRREHRALLRLERQLADRQQRLQDALDASRDATRRYDEQIDALRSELQVCRDVTIPALVASHKLLLQRYDAESAIQARRQVAAMPGSGE